MFTTLLAIMDWHFSSVVAFIYFKVKPQNTVSNFVVDSKLFQYIYFSGLQLCGYQEEVD